MCYEDGFFFFCFKGSSEPLTVSGQPDFLLLIRRLILIRKILISICSCSSITCLFSQGAKFACASILMEFLWNFNPRKVYFTQSLFHPKSQIYGYSCGTINRVHFEQVLGYSVSYFSIFVQTAASGITGADSCLPGRSVCYPVMLLWTHPGFFVLAVVPHHEVSTDLNSQDSQTDPSLSPHLPTAPLWWFLQKCKNLHELAQDKN